MEEKQNQKLVEDVLDFLLLKQIYFQLFLLIWIHFENAAILIDDNRHAVKKNPLNLKKNEN